MHKEDIKAALRKEFGTLVAFESRAGLAHKSVKDVLRGRSSAPTEEAIAKALKQPLHKVFPRRYPGPQGAESSTKGDNSTPERTAHRLTGTGC